MTKKTSRTVDIVYPVCCGMDIHKNFLVACVAVTDERSHTEHHIRRFSTYTKDLRLLVLWLGTFGCRDVCMESAGKYWVPIFNILEAAGLRVCLTHPKYVKAIKGKKTDKKDAKWISELFKCDLVRSSFIPPADIRQLRDLCRYYVKLTYISVSEKNRAQNCLTMCNFKLDAVFSDLFGVSATRILDALLGHGGAGFDIAPLLHKGCKATVEEVADALDGELITEQVAKLSLVRQHREEILKLQASLESLNQESAGKKKTTRIGRAGAYLKPLLVQIALAVSSSDKHIEIKSKYQALKKRRGGKKATIAIARRLLTAMFHMLSKGEAYNAELYHKADKPPKERVMTSEQALDFARRHGFLIEGIDPPPKNPDSAA